MCRQKFSVAIYTDLVWCVSWTGYGKRISSTFKSSSAHPFCNIWECGRRPGQRGGVDSCCWALRPCTWCLHSGQICSPTLFILTSIYWPNRDYSEKFSVLMKIKLLCAHNWSRFWVDFRMVLLHMVLHLQAAPGMMTYWKLALTWLVLRIVHLYIRYMCLATLRLYTVSYIMPIISCWSFSVHWVAALLATMTRWEHSVRSRLLTTSECIL